jgi:hypothetical protein
VGEFDGGGAIFSKSESRVIISKSTFIGNTAANGGAINSLLSNLMVTNSSFTGNNQLFRFPAVVAAQFTTMVLMVIKEELSYVVIPSLTTRLFSKEVPSLANSTIEK